MANKLLDLLFCRTYTQKVPRTEKRQVLINPRGGPHRSYEQTCEVPMGTVNETHRYQSGEWPWARRLKFGLYCGLLTAAVLTIFWTGWQALFGSVPAVRLAHFTPFTGWCCEIPFDISRWFDIPAGLIYGFLLSLLGTAQSLRKFFHSDHRTGPISVMCLSVGGLLGILMTRVDDPETFLVVLSAMIHVLILFGGISLPAALLTNSIALFRSLISTNWIILTATLYCTLIIGLTTGLLIVIGVVLVQLIAAHLHCRILDKEKG